MSEPIDPIAELHQRYEPQVAALMKEHGFHVVGIGFIGEETWNRLAAKGMCVTLSAADRELARQPGWHARALPPSLGCPIAAFVSLV